MIYKYGIGMNKRYTKKYTTIIFLTLFLYVHLYSYTTFLLNTSKVRNYIYFQNIIMNIKNELLQ